jgi:hypothetical protein
VRVRVRFRAGFMVQGLEFRVEGVWFRVKGFKVLRF